jgi:hypothetical protein
LVHCVKNLATLFPSIFPEETVASGKTSAAAGNAEKVFFQMK